jgi:hypothetical protein
VLRRCKAAELAKERAEKQVAHLAMAQETLVITSDVKQQRLITQVRALKQLNEQHEMQILKLTRSPPGAGSEAPVLPHSGSDSISTEIVKTGDDNPVLSATPSAPRETRQAWTQIVVDKFARPGGGQKFELGKGQAADPTSPVSDSTAGAVEVDTRGTKWELDLAWAALAERRAALEELLESGPEMLAE